MSAQTKFAWAKYYEEVEKGHELAQRAYITMTRTVEVPEVPEHVKQELKQMAMELKKRWECPICYDFIEHDKLTITNCGHYFCEPCLDQWKTQQKEIANSWKCCVCNRNHKFKD